MVSYKPTPQPVYSVDIVANSGEFGFIRMFVSTFILVLDGIGNYN